MHCASGREKNAPVLARQCRQGRERESFRGTTLLYRPLTETAFEAAAQSIRTAVTAGRFNGRTRRGLRTLALRPRGSETIFSFLYPARFHLAGLSERTNAKAYSSLHCFFRCCSLRYTKNPDLSRGNFRTAFSARIFRPGSRGPSPCRSPVLHGGRRPAGRVPGRLAFLVGLRYNNGSAVFLPGRNVLPASRPAAWPPNGQGILRSASGRLLCGRKGSFYEAGLF